MADSRHFAITQQGLTCHHEIWYDDTL